ncbi:MAG: hypothetical protein HYX82_03115 [Chloroflexi bacterium]|nr:hypothetical protein [Chloroflexota bacterium]
MKKGRVAPRAKRRKSQGRGKWNLFFGIIAGLVVVAVAVGIINLQSRKGESQSPDDGSNQSVSLPSYVLYSPAQVQEAYKFAAERPDVLQYMPCYCGCGQHSGHMNNWNCFIQSMPEGKPIVWDNHAYT